MSVKKLTKKEIQTMKTYDSKSSDWVSKHETARFWGDQMDKFQSLLPKGKIIEIGSGGGRDAKELVMKGYEYTGTDVSKGLLEIAKKKNPRQKFFQQSVYELDFPENTFDGFWASAVLLHIPKNRIDEALARLRGVVKNNGIGFISIKQGNGEKVEDDEPEMNEKRTRLFSYYQDEEFQKILKKNGFEIVDAEFKPMSERTKWLIYFVRNVKN